MPTISLLRRSVAIDALVAVVTTALAILMLATEVGEAVPTAAPLAYAVAGATGVVLVARRQRPIIVLGLVALARVAVLLEAENSVALIPVYLVALFTAAERGESRKTLIVAIPAAVALALIQADQEGDPPAIELLAEVTLGLLPIALGEVVRSRAERLRSLIETEAAARVQAERLRIARDLHDVAAHGLSTIAIQSGVAARLIDHDIDQARTALEVINDASKRSLEDLRAMVGVLRSSDEVALRPTPRDPNDFSGLTEDARGNGVSVTVEVEGSFPEDVHDAPVVAVHRVIEEALTNVSRHAGPVPARVSIRHAAQQVEVMIRNERASRPGPEPTAPSTGVGIVGMVERVESLGGTLSAQPDVDGGFVVVANIPYYSRPQ